MGGWTEILDPSSLQHLPTFQCKKQNIESNVHEGLETLPLA
jgi:hypothetical protein